MNDLLQLPADLAAATARGALTRLLGLVPPVATPGLDPDLARVARVFDLANQQRQPVPALRLSYELDGRVWQAPLPEGVEVRDEQLRLPPDPSGPARTVTVRTYTPAHTTGGLLVHVHGGGFVIGSLGTHDAVCRRLAAGAGVVVQAVAYRLAPEHPYPAGVTDIAAAWARLHERWVAGGGDPGRIGIGGDSAGGQAAAMVADEAVEPTLGVDVPRPGFCWLVYPGVRTVDAVERMPHEMPEGALLNGPMVARFTRLHVPDAADRDAPALNPLLRSDAVMAEHPPTWIQSVGFDPLREQDEAYALALAAAGVDVDHDHAPAMAHGYISMTGVSQGAGTALGRGTAALRRLVADA